MPNNESKEWKMSSYLLKCEDILYFCTENKNNVEP